MGKNHQQDCNNQNWGFASELEHSGFWIYVPAARIKKGPSIVLWAFFLVLHKKSRTKSNLDMSVG